MSERSETLPSELDPLFDGLDESARRARAALVQDLLASGHALDELLEAHAADRLAMLPVTDVFRQESGGTVAEIAERHGVDVDDLVRSRRAMGLAVAVTEPVHGESLDRHAARMREVLDAGMAVEDLVSFNHVIGAATASIAAGARDSMRAVLERVDPDGTEHTRAVRVAQLATVMTPLLSEVVTVTLEEHIRQTARREVSANLVATGAVPLVDITIGFADLVGFTALGDRVSPDRLGAVATRLEEVARDSCVGDCSLVKTLGDGVMFSGRSPDDMVATVRALAGAAGTGQLPALRVGVARGPAMTRAGDWYGSVVNRASRLTALGTPGQIVVDDATHAALSGDGLDWRDLGPVDVRGLAEPVRCWTAVAG